NVRFVSPSVFNETITSATAHSAIKTTGNLTLGGSVNISFSGLGSMPTPGQTWNLLDYGGALTGSFANMPFDTPFTPTGLPGAIPAGAAFKLKKATGGTNGKLIQLVEDKVLALQVNRDTGEMQIL